MTRRIAIIGGGITGLATAALLADRGDEVTVFEALDDVGGRAGTWEKDGFRFDTGPSWYLMPEVFDHFFALLGTTAAEQLDLVRLDPAYRVYHEGESEPFDVVSGRDAAVAAFEAREAGAGAKLATYLDSAGEIYDLAVSRFLYDPYVSLKGLAHPDVLGKLGTLLPLLLRPLSTHVEKRFSDPVLQQVLGYPAVFLGGSPYDSPSLYHLMSHLDLDDGVLYPRGGFVQIIRAIARLAEERGAEIRTSSPVERIITVGGTATGIRLADGTRIEADHVISTADMHHTETVLLEPELRSRTDAWWDKRVPSFGALLILLGVEGELPELEHHTLLFTRDWKANFEAIFGEDGAGTLPDPPRSTCAAPAPPMTTSRRPATRTCSCSSRCRPTRNSGVVAWTEPATRRSRQPPTRSSRRSPPGPASPTWPIACEFDGPSPPVTLLRTSARSAAALSASRTPSDNPRCSVRGSAPRSTTCSTPDRPCSPAWACPCV